MKQVLEQVLEQEQEQEQEQVLDREYLLHRTQAFSQGLVHDMHMHLLAQVQVLQSQVQALQEQAQEQLAGQGQVHVPVTACVAAVCAIAVLAYTMHALHSHVDQLQVTVLAREQRVEQL